MAERTKPKKIKSVYEHPPPNKRGGGENQLKGQTPGPQDIRGRPLATK